jgi:outer membrane protein assembly factor BamA
VLANLEYIVPLPFEFRRAGFFDVGNVYGFGTKFDLTDLRYAIGGRYPLALAFGPIRSTTASTSTGGLKGRGDFGAVQFLGRLAVLRRSG